MCSKGVFQTTLESTDKISRLHIGHERHGRLPSSTCVGSLWEIGGKTLGMDGGPIAVGDIP